MSEVVLPEGWEQVFLPDVAYISTGKVDANHASINGKYRFYTCAFEPLQSETYSFDDELIVLPGNGANVGHVEFYSGKIEAYQRTYVLHKIAIEPKFLFWNLKKYWKQSTIEKQYGSATNYIKMGNFTEYELFLPPLAEQKVIADKLDSLLAQVDNIKNRLDALPTIIKRFKQSVLSAAVSGKLTEEWRLSNKTTVVSLQEISNQHEASQKRKGVKNYKAPEDFDQKTQHYELPDVWRWFRAEQLCDLITKGTTPSKEKMNSFGDVPYIKVYNLTFDGTLDFTIDPTFVSQSVHESELARSKVFAGDVLMNIVGPPLGKVSIVPATYKEWNINQAISIFRPVCGVTNKYLSICLRNEFLLDLTKAKAKATAGQFNLTLEICRDYSVPVPPLEEQTEIVRRVEQLFTYADQIEQQVKTAQNRVNNLTQSILAKAFRGELTADWRAANPHLISGENSAQALLAKIKAERGQKGKKYI